MYKLLAVVVVAMLMTSTFQACSTTAGNCTACSNNVCTTCATGYGLAALNAETCATQCSTVTPGCSTCGLGKCAGCTVAADAKPDATLGVKCRSFISSAYLLALPLFALFF